MGDLNSVLGNLRRHTDADSAYLGVVDSAYDVLYGVAEELERNPEAVEFFERYRGVELFKHNGGGSWIGYVLVGKAINVAVSGELSTREDFRTKFEGSFGSVLHSRGARTDFLRDITRDETLGRLEIYDPHTDLST